MKVNFQNAATYNINKDEIVIDRDLPILSGFKDPELDLIFGENQSELSINSGVS